MRVIKIKSRIRNYKVIFAEKFNFMDKLNNQENIFFIDKKVYFFYKNTIFKNTPINYHLIDAKEESKTLDYAKILYGKLIKAQIKKRSLIIAIGGGVVQDISGFVASTYYRGINWIYVPTTLLAQSDSCIGSKSSINFNDSKNIIGTFYSPSEIYINPNFINTLSQKDFESGLGEIIKIQLTNTNKNQLEALANKVEKIRVNRKHKELPKIILSSLKIKKVFIEKDEYDKGIRIILNYGHTLGHAIESVSKFHIAHGTAILIGIIFANLLSVKREMLQEKTFEAINNQLVLPNINKRHVRKDYFLSSALIDRVKSDKKRINNNLSFIIPTSAFKLIKIEDVKEQEFVNVLDNFRKSILPLISR